MTVRGASSGGTGWVLDAEKGHVVTNAHVAINDESFTIGTFDGKTGTATRVGYHREMRPDLALVQTDLDGLSEFSIGDESTLRAGDPLLTIGHPGRYGDWVMSIGRYDSYRSVSDWILSTVPTSQGNSGGPLFTPDGDVVGVISGTTRSGETEDYSKSNELYAEFPEIRELTTGNPVTTLMDSVNEWLE
ncbi:S1C family serine protease [Haloterrigena gelatinilytica]|uniref:S1C family serine protease n=1 Tax=Haloterrigena gelatinilytica TaxID=2741724 RepID=UPI002811F35E|nr:serine protease [Haloterrigena gelatinilytica]